LFLSICAPPGGYIIYTDCARRKKANVPDRGGSLLSIPVRYFNDQGGWKKQFADPSSTFVVGIVQFTNTTAAKHDICFIGTPSTEIFAINDTVYIEFRALWEAHGQRMVPCYEYDKQPTVLDADDAPISRKGQ
jgi:hypothetical protein